MGVTIDTISIEIESSSIGAAKGIDALAKSLEGLKKNGSFSTVSKNLNNLSDALKGIPNVYQASNSLRTLANSVEKLKGVGSVAGLANSLKKLPEALKGIGKIDLDAVAPQIEKVVSAVAPLSAVKAGGLNTMMNSLKKLGEVTKSLDDDTIKAFADRVAQLNEKLTPLSQKMSTIKTGFNAINQGARKAEQGVKELKDEINTTTLNLSNFIDVASTMVDGIRTMVQMAAEFMHEATQWDGIEYQFGNAFGEQADIYYDKITKITDALKINKQMFMENSAMATSMLLGFGVNANDAREMGLGYTELAYDIWAAFNNVYTTLDGADGAMAAVRSAIAGEVEPIRRAGFTIVESQLEQTAANHGLKISIESATEAQKSYLRYLSLVDQAHTKGIVGTYASEMEKAEGMVRTLSQQWKSLTQSFASLFIPIMVKVLPYIQAFVDLLKEGVYWLANLLGVELQSVDFSDYKTGANNLDGIANSAEGATGALNDATEAAKELKNATLGIDELNVISPTSASSGSGSGGSGGGAGGGFDGLDVGSLWDETIFDTIQSDVDAIKEKMRGWMPILGSVAAALTGLRLVKLLEDVGLLEKSKLFNGGLKLDLGSLKDFTDWLKAFSDLAKEGGFIAALGAAFPKISAWLAGLPGALSTAIAALSAAAPYIAIAAAVVAGLVLAFVDYDFTEIGRTIGEKVGQALRWAFENLTPIGLGIKLAKWLMKELDVDNIWDLIKALFNPITWTDKIFPAIINVFNSVNDFINDKIENFKGNINEFFAGFFDGLFDGLGIDMSWAEKFTDIFDIEYMDIVEFVVNPLSIGQNIINGIVEGIKSGDFFGSIKAKFEEFVGKVKEFFGIHSPSTLMRDQIGKNLVAGITSGMSLSAIKDRLSSMWSEAKTWWDSKKAALASYTPSIGNIATKISSAWESAKTWWGKKTALSTYTPSIGSIYEKLKERWDNARTWWNDKKTKAKEYTPSIGSIYEKLSERWKNAREWWNKKKGSMSYTPSIGSITDKLKSAWSSAKSWWNKNVKLSIPSLSFKVSYSTPSSKTMKAIMNALDLPGWPKLSFAAGGGIFDQGSLIWAGERGPEVMAEASGGRTGVMNVQQMQDAVYEGVYAAVSAAMRGMNGGGSGQDVRVYLDGREISSSVRKHQHESGATIMGNEVYAY